MKQNMKMLFLIVVLLTITSYTGITQTVVAQSNVPSDFAPDIEYNPTYELVAIARTDDVGIYASNMLLLTTLPRDPNSRSRPGVAWRPDGLQLAMINGADITIWDYDPLTNSFTQNTTIQPVIPVYYDPLDTDVLVRAVEWQQQLAVTYLYQPSGLNLLPGVVALFDTQTWTTTTVIENPDIFGDPSMFMLAPYIATSPSGGQLVTSNNFCRFIVLGDSCEFPEVLLADLATEQIVWQYETLVDIFDIAWAPDGSRFAISADEVFIFDATTRSLVFTWADTIDYPTYIEWSDDSQRLLSLNAIGEGQILDTQSYTVAYNFQIDVTVERIRAIEWKSSTDSLFVGTNDSMLKSQYTGTNCGNCIVETFHLIDTTTGDTISQLSNSAVIELVATGTHIAIRADVSIPVVGSVVFDLNGTPNVQTDDSAPYEFTNWTPEVGLYTLTATPYSGAGGTGTAGIPLTISFTIIDSGGTVGGPNQILFSSVTDPFTAASNIFIINPDGTGQTQLTTGSSIKNFPAWSPDGTQILYTSNQDGDDEIFVMNADGTNPVQLTSNTALDRFPVWSPDSTQIAFASYRDGNWEIYTMNADGSNPVNLTSNTADDFNVSWSPDGSQIAFASLRDGTSSLDTEIYVMNADGTNVQRLTNSPSIDETPNWSPDGTQIAFTSDRSAGNIDIYTMNADGTNVQRLTTYSGTDEFPNWSPDGTQIAFDSNRSSLFNLYFDIHTMNADGTNVQRITTNGAFDRFAAWGYP